MMCGESSFRHLKLIIHGDDQPMRGNRFHPTFNKYHYNILSYFQDIIIKLLFTVLTQAEYRVPAVVARRAPPAAEASEQVPHQSSDALYRRGT